METNLYIGSKPNHITDTYFNIHNNSPFSKLKKDELKFLLSNLNFPLTMRDTLNISEINTFGTEIEFIRFLKLREIEEMIKNSSSFKLIEKWSLIKERSESKHELISPILRDNHENWKELKIACDILQSIGGTTSEFAGSHIHIGSQILKDEIQSIIDLLIFWAVYENIIYRFSYGEDSNYRKNIPNLAEEIRRKILNNSSEIIESISISSIIRNANIEQKKNNGIDFSKTIGNEFCNGNTIEIRCPNATIKSEIWQNNINFFIKMLLYVNSDRFDRDHIYGKFKELKKKPSNLERYYLLDIPNAIELGDMIFSSPTDTNLDKLYYLRQYYKNGDESGRFSRKINLTKVA